MQPSNRVRTYLDPDAVGPLPRSVMADDSDELAAARTMVRFSGTTTVEIRPDDVIEVVDPNRPSSLAPVGYETAIILPRSKAGRWVLAGLAGALGLLIAVAIGTMPRTPELSVSAVAAAPLPIPGATMSPAPVVAAVPVPAPTTGTLRVDGAVDGQRLLVDGVVLSAPAALLRCGEHEVAVGSSGRSRTIEVPCGGEVTIFR